MSSDTHPSTSQESIGIIESGIHKLADQDFVDVFHTVDNGDRLQTRKGMIVPTHRSFFVLENTWKFRSLFYILLKKIVFFANDFMHKLNSNDGKETLDVRKEPWQ